MKTTIRSQPSGDRNPEHATANWRVSQVACAPLLTAVVLFGATLVAPIAHGAVHYQRLKSFASIPDDGASPHAGLMEGSDGALYGTTIDGTDNAGALCLLGANTPLTRASGSPAVETGQKQKSSEQIPWSELGVRAGAQYQGYGLAIVSAERGAVLRCLFQKLEGEATAEGVWLSSTATGAVNDRFRAVAVAVGRDCPQGAETVWGLPIGNRRYSRLEICATGTVEVAPEVVRFIRPGMVEEYSVSMDGVRQDFIIAQKPAGPGELRVELNVEGARAETGPHGARLVLQGSGRKIAYSRLRVADAEGRALNARIEVVSARRLALRVADAAAVYPVRIDPTFSDENWISMGAPGADAAVGAVVADGSGNLYVGGDLTFVGGVLANHVAKWNGSAWTALGSGLNDYVTALAVSGSDLFVGGYFTTAGGNAATNIAKWNGSAWTALGSGLNGGVTALAVSGSDLYVGGVFTTAGGNAARNIAKWDGSAWTALGSGLNEQVNALAVSGSDLYVGGMFTTAGGNAATNIAKWNGSAWTALGSGLNGWVLALAVSGSDLYVGGYFTGGIANWNGSAWAALGSGMGGPWAYVSALAVSGSDLYVSGRFTTAGGNAATNIAKWNGSAWTALGSGLGGGGPYSYSDSYIVSALAVSGSDLYVGGYFTTAGGNSAANIAKWDGSAWTALAIGSGLNGQVNALAVSGSDLYVGGYFTTAGGNPAYHVAKWNGSAWSALGSGLAGGYSHSEEGDYTTVNALAVSGSDLYVGGDFTTADGNPAYHVAKWNGSAWSALGSGMGGYYYPHVFALAVSGSDLYVGGGFTTAGGNAATNIAKWNGSAWTALGSGLNGDVTALAVSGSDLYVGGDFTTAGGNPANYVAKWNGGAWTALGSGVDGPVHALAVSGSDLYVGGVYTTAGGNAANYVAKWNGGAWTALGSGLNRQVYALAVSGSDLYAGGYFTTAGGKPANYVAKWNGGAWTALGSGINGGVYALAVSGSDLYVGGEFRTAGGKVSAYLAKANISPLSQPGIVNINLAGTDVAIGGTNGPAGAAYYALASTNVALPLTNWTRLATNRFDASGNFTFTNRIAPTIPQQFYLLQVP